MGLALLAGVLAYLIGSVLFAPLIVRQWFGVDIHTVGSGNPGAMNTFKNVNRLTGLFVLLGDLSKALLALWVADRLIGTNSARILAGLGVILGHNWSLYSGFRGGKGLASLGGVWLYLDSRLLLVGLGCYVILQVATRRMGVSVCIALILTIVVAWQLLVVNTAPLIFTTCCPIFLFPKQWRDIRQELEIVVTLTKEPGG